MFIIVVSFRIILSSSTPRFSSLFYILALPLSLSQVDKHAAAAGLLKADGVVNLDDDSDEDDDSDDDHGVEDERTKGYIDPYSEKYASNRLRGATKNEMRLSGIEYCYGQR